MKKREYASYLEALAACQQEISEIGGCMRRTGCQADGNCDQNQNRQTCWNTFIANQNNVITFRSLIDQMSTGEGWEGENSVAWCNNVPH